MWVRSLLLRQRTRIKYAEQRHRQAEANHIQILEGAVTIDDERRNQIEQSIQNIDRVMCPQRHDGPIGEEGQLGAVVRHKVERGVNPPEEEELHFPRLACEAEVCQRKDGQLEQTVEGRVKDGLQARRSEDGVLLLGPDGYLRRLAGIGSAVPATATSWNGQWSKVQES